MNLQQAVDFVKHTLRDAEAFGVRWSFDEQQADPFHHNWRADDFKEALGVLLRAATTAPKPIGYIEPGKTYVLQIDNIDDYSVELVDVITKTFNKFGCDVIVLGPGMHIIQPGTRNTNGNLNELSTNPCDSCKTRFECSGVREILAKRLNQ